MAAGRSPAGGRDARLASGSTPAISICIVTARRPALLDACLQSLQAQTNAPAFELLVCCNGDAAAAEVVWARFPDAVVGMTEPTAPGGARNFLVERARGGLLLFLDDDVVVHPTLLRHLADLGAAWPETVVFGGPNETPAGSSQFQVVQGAVLASIAGSGPVRRRYGRHPAGPADERFFTLCNLAIRREAMLPFPRDLVCAEENVVLSELSRGGTAMRYDPGLVVFHERRPSGPAFLAQIFGYGRGRGQLLTRAPRTFAPVFAVPVMLLLYLALLPVLVRYGWPFVLPLLAYGLLLIGAGVRVAWTLRRPGAAPLAAALVGGLHLSYGAGIVAGLVAKPPGAARAPGFHWLNRPNGPRATGPGEISSKVPILAPGPSAAAAKGLR